MPVVYTCICDGQDWIIFGREIRCKCCGAIYHLNWCDDEMESAEDFNERIRNV